MVKQVQDTAGPNIMDILELLGHVEPTKLGQLLLKDKNCQRPHLGRLAPFAGRKRAKMTLVEVARILKCPVSRI